MKGSHKCTIWILIFVTFLLPVMVGCQESQVQAQIAVSDVQRNTAPQVPSVDRSELVTGNSAFAFDLYQHLRREASNLFFSPYSISTALAMTYAGARGETQRQMAQTLHYTLPQEHLHAAFNALNLELGDPAQEEFQLHIANAIWGQAGYPFLAPFLGTLAENYGAGLRLLDFQQDPDVARGEINAWVSDETEERIQDLIPVDAITADTRLVLANAIYFLADWVFPFEAAKTSAGGFYTLDGREVSVPMMSMLEPRRLAYARGEGFQAVELPYKSGTMSMSMLILVPDAGQFEAFEDALDAVGVEGILAELEPRQVALSMPKFAFESEFGLGETLSEMGMPDAFGPADFSGMDGSRNLFISDVFHKAYVAVDEAGTEAAAATAVLMKRLSMPMADVTLSIDRPFIFVIREGETGSVLFLGRMMNPSLG
jgi:serpin B